MKSAPFRPCGAPSPASQGKEKNLRFLREAGEAVAKRLKGAFFASLRIDSSQRDEVFPPAVTVSQR